MSKSTEIGLRRGRCQSEEGAALMRFGGSKPTVAELRRGRRQSVVVMSMMRFKGSMPAVKERRRELDIHSQEKNNNWC